MAGVHLVVGHTSTTAPRPVSRKSLVIRGATVFLLAIEPWRLSPGALPISPPAGARVFRQSPLQETPGLNQDFRGGEVMELLIGGLICWGLLAAIGAACGEKVETDPYHK